MQHLDEGTIHSWLDGALSPEEAARLEAHVAECPQCAAAVAEARGFIAASSRILTALDNAPRGVIPVAAPAKRVNPLVWRVAATVLVVAAGTLVVVQNRGSNEQLKAVSATQAVTRSQAPSVSEPVSAAQEMTARAADGAAANMRVSQPPTVASAKAPATAATGRGNTAGAGKGAPARASVRDEATDAVSDLARAPTPPAPAVSGVAAGVAMDAAVQPEMLKVISSPREAGAQVTVYEVAAGDTVTLTESMPVGANMIRLRGATSMAPQKAAAAAPRDRAELSSTGTAATESRRTAEAAAAAPAIPTSPPTAKTGAVIAVNTITWTDPATGSRLTLSGRMPESRLQEIRIRIERERATAAAAKKNP